MPSCTLKNWKFGTTFQFKGIGGKSGDDQVKFTFQCQQIKLYKPCATRYSTNNKIIKL